MNYSLTYIATIVGAVLSVFSIADVSQADLLTTVKVIAVIIAGLVTLYGRYRAGGLSALGFRTKK